MRNVSSSMNQIGRGVKRRKLEDSTGYQRNSRLGKSHAAPLAKKRQTGMLQNPLTESHAFERDDEEDQNFSRRADEFQTIQASPSGPQRKGSKASKQV